MTTYVKASCHCRLNAFNIAFTTDSLPVTNILCHCSSCRHSSGQTMCNFVPFMSAPLALNSTEHLADLSTLTTYRSSIIATRRFCGRCSSQIFWEHHSENGSKWYVASGSLERVEGILNTTYHVWVGDTLDGGIADHIPIINGASLPRYIGNPVGWQALELNADNADATPDQAEEHLHAYCNCKKNSFWITRPSAASTLPSSPYPDVTHAYTTFPKEVQLNPSDEKWWLRPLGAAQPTHYLAGHCACTSCRTTSGFEIQSWAFIPRANILFPPNDTGELAIVDLQDPDKRPNGLRRYGSSRGRNREFCGTCGATVFWWGEERPDLVDVSVGLLDEKQNGVRAEKWLEWWKERVSFQEDAINVKLVSALAEGLKASKA